MRLQAVSRRYSLHKLRRINAAITTCAFNRVLDAFNGKLGKARWTAPGKCSAETALRDMNELLARDRRSTGHELYVK